MTNMDLESANFIKNLQYTNNLISTTLENLVKRLSDLTTKVNLLEKELQSSYQIIQQKDIKPSPLQKSITNKRNDINFASIKEDLGFLIHKFELLEQNTNYDIDELRNQNKKTMNYAETKIQELEKQVTEVQNLNSALRQNSKSSEIEKANISEKSVRKEQKNLAELDGQLQTANQEILALKAQIIELKNEKNDTEEEIQTYTNQINEFNSRIQDLLKKIDLLESQNAIVITGSPTKAQDELTKRMGLEEQKIPILPMQIENISKIIKETNYSEENIFKEGTLTEVQNNTPKQENTNGLNGDENQITSNDEGDQLSQKNEQRNQVSYEQQTTFENTASIEDTSRDLSKELVFIEEKYQDKILKLEKVVIEQKLQLEETKKRQDEYIKLEDWKNRVIELENTLTSKENSLQEQKIQIEVFKHKLEIFDDIEEWKNRARELEHALNNRDQIIGHLKIKLENLEQNQNSIDKWQSWKDRAETLENILSYRDNSINDLKIELELSKEKIKKLEDNTTDLLTAIPKNDIEQEMEASKFTNAAIIEDLRTQIVGLENLLIKTQTELAQAKKDLAIGRYPSRRKDLEIKPEIEDGKENLTLNEYSQPEMPLEWYKKQIKILQQEIISLENDLEDSDDELEEVEEQITQIKENNEFLKTELETKKTLLEKRDNQLEIMANEFEALRRQLETIDNTRAIEGLKEALKLTESALQKTRTQVSQVNEQISIKEELQNILEEKDKKIEELQIQLKTTKIKIDEYEKAHLSTNNT